MPNRENRTRAILSLIIVGFLFGGLLGFLTGCSTGPTRKERKIAKLHLEIGTTYLTHGKYHIALSQLLAAQKNDPENAEVQNNLGLTYFFLGHLKTARDHLKKAISLDSSFSEARNNLARVDISLALYGEAETLAKQVLADLTYPTPQKAWINLGLVSFHEGQYQKAEQRFRKALKLDHRNCLAYDYFGRSFYESRQYAVAAKVLDQAINYCKADKFAEPQYYSALSYYKLGNTEKALARLDEIVNDYPSGKYAKRAEKMRSLMR